MLYRLKSSKFYLGYIIRLDTLQKVINHMSSTNLDNFNCRFKKFAISLVILIIFAFFSIKLSFLSQDFEIFIRF